MTTKNNALYCLPKLQGEAVIELARAFAGWHSRHHVRNDRRKQATCRL
jgi:hypothetical protein